jgi:hypothetical protein
MLPWNFRSATFGFGCPRVLLSILLIVGTVTCVYTDSASSSSSQLMWRSRSRARMDRHSDTHSFESLRPCAVPYQPPCMRHRPFGIAGARHAVLRRALAPDRGARFGCVIWSSDFLFVIAASLVMKEVVRGDSFDGPVAPDLVSPLAIGLALVTVCTTAAKPEFPFQSC